MIARAFTRFANATSWLAGHYVASLLAMFAVVIWLVVGPIVAFSDSWLIFMGTATSIIAFLMVFIIQHTQNRDAVAVHLKLNELLRAVEGANPAIIRVEAEDDEELVELRQFYARLSDDQRNGLNEMVQHAARDDSDESTPAIT
jgi:low affinity Fe/Cu permease